MSKKISIIVLLIVFVVILFVCSNLMNNMQEVPNNIENKKEEDENMEILKVSSANFESEVLKSDKTVLIDFYADWCGPCKMLSPIVEDVAKSNTDIKVVKINLDENEDLAIKFGVTAIPTLVVIKNGEEINRTVGLVSKSEIEAMIK